MKERVYRGFLVAAVTALTIGFGVAAAPFEAFEAALCCIPLEQTDRILAAVELGYAQEDFPADDLLRLVERLVDHPSSTEEKEAILLTVTSAIEEGLPIQDLLSKASEGLARGVTLFQIESGLHQRLILLIEVRDLLYAKGIFSVPSGSPQSVPSALPTPRFNELITNISDAVGDHLEGGGSPFDGNVLLQQVQERLTALQGVTLLQADVELVLERIESADLTQVALAAVS
jgi:hypothetical protein